MAIPSTPSFNSLAGSPCPCAHSYLYKCGSLAHVLPLPRPLPLQPYDRMHLCVRCVFFYVNSFSIFCVHHFWYGLALNDDERNQWKAKMNKRGQNIKYHVVSTSRWCSFLRVCARVFVVLFPPFCSFLCRFHWSFLADALYVVFMHSIYGLYFDISHFSIAIVTCIFSKFMMPF